METTEALQPPSSPAPHLQRRIGLLQAIALNMSNMIGVGPFITIPLLMSALNGPLSILGWGVALVICLADGLIWSELGAAMPGSGGSYIYLREAFGPAKWGRLMAFLFIWQFIFSGPFEIASGYAGISQYLQYVWPTRTVYHFQFLTIDPLIILLGAFTIFLLYRNIQSIGKITISLWIGSILTTAIVIVLGVAHFNPKVAFDFPPGGFQFSLGFFLGLGSAARIGVYDYLGYYDVCYLGEEVKNPARVIPRSILISLTVVALIYLGINLSIIGVVPWREFVPAGATPKPVVSMFMERIAGKHAAIGFTGLVLWTAFASVFALLLGYSRIPYAAALNGYFFAGFGKLHPTKNFPYRSLLVIGVLSILCSFFSLQIVIDALITTRILIQFIGQAAAVIAVRKYRRDIKLPFRMWLYPLPCLIAFAGWTFIFLTAEFKIILAGILSIILGVIAFFAWSFRKQTWPFQAQTIKSPGEIPGFKS